MIDYEGILWEADGIEARKYIDVPAWIDQEIDCTTIAAILQGGCASGAYMPAVTYFQRGQALETMAEHGDDVLDYIQDSYGELPAPDDAGSWSGMACHYLSIAVELWASGVAEELADEIKSKHTAA